MWLAMNEPIVTVYELVAMPDGTTGIGCSLEVPVSEAVVMIKQGQAFAAGLAPRDVVPDEWKQMIEPNRVRGGGKINGDD